MDRRQFFINSAVFALAGCGSGSGSGDRSPVDASPKAVNSRSPSKVLTREEMAEFLELRAKLVSDLKLVSRVAAPSNKLGFEYAKAKDYRINYCQADNKCPDSELDLDCTHFACHGLNSGGVFINDPTATCSSGLGIRVNDLAESFHNSVGKYSNVTQISSHSATREGDFCFIPGWFGLKKSHVMVLSETATSTGSKVWAHTNNRCANFVSYEGESCAYYRIG